MKKYKVVWTEEHSTFIKANSKEEAIEKVGEQMEHMECELHTFDEFGEFIAEEY